MPSDIYNIEVMEHKNVCKWYEVCPLKEFHEQGKVDKRWVEDYCFGNYTQCIRKRMEEEGKYHPDNMMPDGTIDNALR